VTFWEADDSVVRKATLMIRIIMMVDHGQATKDIRGPVKGLEGYRYRRIKTTAKNTAVKNNNGRPLSDGTRML
jgi:hypothetical protein